MSASTARLNGIRISPRKMRVIANLIRGADVAQAINQLRFLQRSGAREFFKLLVSAVANAEDKGGDPDGLIVKTVMVDSGQTLKRWRPRARGRATPIMKRSSRVFVELAQGDGKTRRTRRAAVEASAE